MRAQAGHDRGARAAIVIVRYAQHWRQQVRQRVEPPAAGAGDQAGPRLARLLERRHDASAYERGLARI
jgi:hypothetical protein